MKLDVEDEWFIFVEKKKKEIVELCYISLRKD